MAKSNIEVTRIRGVWGGYVIHFKYNKNVYEVETLIGIRSLNVPVDILIIGNKISAYHDGNKVKLIKIKKIIKE